MLGVLLAVTVLTRTVGPVNVECADRGAWEIEACANRSEEGVEVLRITLSAPVESIPPAFAVRWFFSQYDIHHVWSSSSTHYGIPWNEAMCSELTSALPLYAYFNASGRNKMTVSCSESCRRVVYRSPISETKMGFDASFSFFGTSEPPLRSYSVEIRFDGRDVPYARAIGDAADWMCRVAGIEPMPVPEDAFEPLYSTWYDFHQDVSAAGVEEECALAAKLGLKTVIVDDGWQIDLPLGNRPWNGYRLCGDWRPGRHFPDMAAHVKRVQDLGLKYMLWYSVPFVGKDSLNFARFKGKFLPVECAGGHVLDPRFPEVREFIVRTYEDAVRDWNIDGLKLDFIGRFALKDGVVDPAIAENYAGRDIKTIPLAVDRLLTDVMKRLKAIKPDILIEFRQPYVGSAIRRYANMLRASDCPLSMVENRTRIARLRLTSGKTAVHSDMLEWRADETPEGAARHILNAIFGVVQYSVRLSAISESHRSMMAHWIRFAASHKDALVKGAFRPHVPAADYPLLEGESAAERIFGLYQEDLVVDVGSADRDVYVLNGTGAASISVRLPAEPERIEVYDTFGKLVDTPSGAAGLVQIPVPVSGYVKFIWQKAADSQDPPGTETVLLECERFDDCGGWTVDSQFRMQMGSSYLLAHGLGQPVSDAQTRFTVREGGSYGCWVRTKNWTAPWSSAGGAGAFSVRVDGKVLPTRLGTQGEGEWLWVKADDVRLEPGEHEIALRDLDGFDGRVDCVCLTKSAKPARAVRVDKPKAVTHDLTVVGGGIAGICTAISAARLGLSVALVQDRLVLGGNNSSEVRVHLGAWQNMPPYPRLGDVLAEIGPKAGGNARPAANYEDDRKLAVVKAEKNIDLFLGTQVDEVRTNALGRIETVVGENVVSGERVAFSSPYFVDCTGDGTVGALAGAHFRQGRESRSEYGEPTAPERADAMTMGASVQWYAERTTIEPCSFPVGKWMLAFDEKSVKPGMRGDWDWETGIGRDQVREAERIRDYGLLVVYSNWSYLKNAYSRKSEFGDARLAWVAFVAGKRESRRLLGDFVLTERHLDDRAVQPDGTCVTTWTIDQHYPWDAAHTGFAGEPFQAESRNKAIWPYPVPYRCFYSRNVRNLFMAGRNVSVSHVALGTTRLMRTHGMMGEVVGMAASLCRKYGCDPRSIYEGHLDELKALMEKGVGDGKPHPPQMYNLQISSDPRFMDRESGNCQIVMPPKNGRSGPDR